MHIGFFNAPLAGVPMEELADWASHNNFDSLEIEVPLHQVHGRSDATFISANRKNKRLVARIRRILDDAGLFIDALTFHANLLTPSRRERLQLVAHLCKVMRLAALLEVKTVCCVVGRDPKRTLAENLAVLPAVLSPIVKCASQTGVRVAIENDPLIGWQFEGLHGNVAFSPVVWEKIFEEVSDKNLGLALDPSFLVLQQIDVSRTLMRFKNRLFLFRARDVEIDVEARAACGNTFPGGWWRSRVPGLGEMDWGGMIGELKSVGYDGAVVITHGDPVWSGSASRLRRGLTLGQAHLRKFIS